MKSNLLKLTSGLSLVAFMAVTFFANPAQADIVSANDVVIDATHEYSTLTGANDTHVAIYKCFIYKCEIEKKEANDSVGN